MPQGSRKGGIRRIVLNKAVPRPIGPYSHAVIAGGFAFVSGQGPRDAATGRFVEGGIKEHTRQTFRNIRAILKAIGLDLSDVVKVNAYLRDMKDFQEFNEVYAGLFKGGQPARTTLQATLPNPGMLVEIEVVAKTKE